MKNLFFLVFFFCFTITIYSQKEANIWYFGNRAGLDFNSGTPVSLSDGELNTSEGCASISDVNGNLLFYTDGTKIWDRRHQVMAIGLKGNPSSTNSSIIVPKPNSNTIYYVLTVDAQAGENGLQYSEVDISLNNGFGGVNSVKNILLHTPTTEKLTAIKNSVDDEYWVVSHKWESNEFIAFKINSAGINMVPVVSAVGTYIGSPFNSDDTNPVIGSIKFSPDGSKIAVANNGSDEVQLFSFNLETGVISNPITLTGLPFTTYGVEFSPNNNILYVSTSKQGVYQYNLLAGTESDINNSKITLTAPPLYYGEHYGQLQLATDRKIYVAAYGNSSLHVINNPNILGLGCDFQVDAVPLNGLSYFGLPTFIQSYFNIDTFDIENTCFGDTTKFLLPDAVDSVVWDFGDPLSGINNTSTDINSTHVFSEEGTFNVSVTATFGTQTETISNQVIITTSPFATNLSNLFACEDITNTGFSSNFDTSNVQNLIAGSQTSISIEYYAENGSRLSSPLPNPMTNTTQNSEQITARVFFTNNAQCFSETTFQLVVQSIPELEPLDDLNSCDLGNGFSSFDLTTIQSQITSSGILKFYDSNYDLINNASLSSYANIVSNLDVIYVRLINPSTDCYSEIVVNLIVAPIPEANQLQIIYGCDDNNDGISEYFDTSNIESQVLNGQTGMTVSYFDESGNQLSNPLSNPFTNSNPFNELITLRVTDTNTTCYDETTLELQTLTQPNINQPDNLYVCDQGNGYAEFNTSNIEQQLIGNQTGLTIQYYDSNYNPLPSPLPVLFQNTEPFSQTISVRVEDASNPICYSETSFDLIVNDLPEINLEEDYYICNLDPSITLSVDPQLNSFTWNFEDGSLVSSTHEAELTDEGNYILTVTQINNGIICENTFSFNLIRSDLPEIIEINYGELGNNYIEVITAGDGDFEYSIDGINYQDSNYFSNIQGGIYTVFVRDKDGCGQDSEEVTIIDYPKFFTPNNDGYNDFWQIKGIANLPNSKILIFDRYGKLLTQLASNDVGWNGLYNGKQMISNDYWFRVDLDNGRFFSGHFALKR